MPASDVILTLFESLPLNQIDLATEHQRQLLLHIAQVEQGPPRIRREGHQDVDVAVRAKVFVQDRAKKRKGDDLSATTEVADLLGR